MTTDEEEFRGRQIKIYNPGLLRGLNAIISLESVVWFKCLFKSDGVGTLSDQPSPFFLTF